MFIIASDRFKLSDVTSESFEYNEYNINTTGILIKQLLESQKLEYSISAKSKVV